MRSALLWIGLAVFIAGGGFIVMYQVADLPTSSEQSTESLELEQRPRVQQGPQIEQPRQVSSAASETVFIAPYSGKRYHATESCRGLSNARSVEAVSLSEAQGRGLTPCKICY